MTQFVAQETNTACNGLCTTPHSRRRERKGQADTLLQHPSGNLCPSLTVLGNQARSPLAAWGTGKRPGTGEMPLTGEEREKRYGAAAGSGTEYHECFQKQQQKPCPRQTVRTLPSLRTWLQVWRGSVGEVHPGLGSIPGCPSARPTQALVSPLAGVRTAAVGVSSVLVKPGNRNLKYLERRELVAGEGSAEKTTGLRARP